MSQTLNNSLSSKASITNNIAAANTKAFLGLEEAQKVAQMFSAQIVNKIAPSIGSLTGNYVLQERVQSSVSVVNKVVDLGLTFAINPYLGAFALVSEGVGLALEVAQRNREIMWQNRSANELARRAGYLSDQNR